MAGLDEVGRGAWAGPLTVGVAVVRPRVQLRSMPAWLRDSKMLSEARREDIFTAVGAWCQDWSVGHASPAECDEWGMTEALRVAARRALDGLGEPPQAVLVDGPVDLLRHPDDPLRRRGAAHRRRRRQVRVGGGGLGPGQGGAGPRDARGGGPLPGLRLRAQQGLSLPLHQAALRGYGPTAIHRRSWAFVA